MYILITQKKKTMSPYVNLTINIDKKYLPPILPNSMPNLESEIFLDNPTVPRVNSELFAAPIICSSPITMPSIISSIHMRSFDKCCIWFLIDTALHTTDLCLVLESVISVVVRGGPLSGELFAVRCSSKGFSDRTISVFCYFCSRLSALLGGSLVPCSSMVRM